MGMGKNPGGNAGPILRAASLQAFIKPVGVLRQIPPAVQENESPVGKADGIAHAEILQRQLGDLRGNDRIAQLICKEKMGAGLLFHNAHFLRAAEIIEKNPRAFPQEGSKEMLLPDPGFLFFKGLLNKPLAAGVESGRLPFRKMQHSGLEILLIFDNVFFAKGGKLQIAHGILCL